MNLLPDWQQWTLQAWGGALVPLAPMLVLLAVAAVIDARKRRIPNWLNLAILVGGLVASTVAGGLGYGGVGGAVLGILAGFGLTFPAFVLRANGGGDVKLFAAMGAWLGPGGVLVVFVLQALLGLVIVLVQAAAGGKLRELWQNAVVLVMHVGQVHKLGVEHVAETGNSVRSIDRPLPWAVPVFVATLAAPLFM